MYDLKISGGLVVDGSGAPGRVVDIGVVGDRIVAMGNLPEAAVEEIDATGRVVTPGFVDIHTHYDGQATWDQEMAPSSWHGVKNIGMKLTGPRITLQYFVMSNEKEVKNIGSCT